MKFATILATSAFGQYEPGYDAAGYDAGYDAGYKYPACGPTAAEGGAFWPSQSAAQPCGVQFFAEQVTANAKCQLQLKAGASYFLTLGGVFVTSPGI